MNNFLHKAVAAFIALTAAGFAHAQENPAKQVYMAANAHFDTQWRWNVRQSIGEFLPNTLYQNFALM